MWDFAEFRSSRSTFLKFLTCETLQSWEILLQGIPNLWSGYLLIDEIKPWTPNNKSIHKFVQLANTAELVSIDFPAFHVVPCPTFLYVLQSFDRIDENVRIQTGNQCPNFEVKKNQQGVSNILTIISWLVDYIWKPSLFDFVLVNSLEWVVYWSFFFFNTRWTSSWIASTYNME